MFFIMINESFKVSKIILLHYNTFLFQNFQIPPECWQYAGNRNETRR